MNLAIERDTKLVYESTSTWGYPVWPTPILLQVKIVPADQKIFHPSDTGDILPHSLLFREDSYDSISRIRRGRIYRAFDSTSQQWNMWPHPAQANEAILGPGANEKSVYAFYSFRLKPYLKSVGIFEPVFLLGADQAFTIWTLVSIETSITRDEMVILRARKSIGALPKLNRELILELNGQTVLDYIDKLEEDIYRAGPQSVIDRCREAVTSILSIYLQDCDKLKPGFDLNKLADKMAEKEFVVVANSARIIARFHARWKHAEQEKRPTRHVTEQDAEFAIQAVGIILCDLEWASWQ